MQDKQDGTPPQTSPDKPPMTHDVIVGYGVGGGSEGPRWVRWWRKVQQWVWPSYAGVVRRVATIGVAFMFVTTIPLGILLVSDTGMRQLVTDMNGGSQQQEEGNAGSDRRNGGNGEDEEEGASGGEGQDDSEAQDQGTGNQDGSGGSGDGQSDGNSGGDGDGGGATPPPPPPSNGCDFPSFPDASCTGWQHTGVSLHTSGCPTEITINGATYDSCRFTGAVLVDASNVTITRSLIEGRVVSLSSDDSLLGLTLTDVEIDGQGVWDFNQAAIGNSDYTCTRCHIHSTGRGANITDNVRIEDSYLHGWVTQDGDHETAIGSNGGSGNQITHNNIVCDSSGCSAALSLYGDFAQINDWLIQKNLFNTSSGGYCTHAGSDPGKPFPNATNVRYIDNYFSKQYNAQCGVFGPVTSWAFNSGNVWSGNVWADGSGSVEP